MGPASVRIGNYQLDVESIEGNAITQVKVTPLSFMTPTTTDRSEN